MRTVVEASLLARVFIGLVRSGVNIGYPRCYTLFGRVRILFIRRRDIRAPETTCFAPPVAQTFFDHKDPVGSPHTFFKESSGPRSNTGQAGRHRHPESMLEVAMRRLHTCEGVLSCIAILFMQAERHITQGVP
jgi:hypothetical protein